MKREFEPEVSDQKNPTTSLTKLPAIVANLEKC